MVLTFVRGILLLMIFLGYLHIAYDKLGIASRFVPIFVTSCITLCVYMGSIFGLLLPATILVAVAGVIGFFYMIYDLKGRKLSLKSISFFRVFFGLGIVLFLLQLLYTDLTHYDNFTHWAVIVKEMLLTNKLPTSDSVMIEFTNYPTGTTSFIYFVCKIVGSYENIMIFAQGIMIFGCFIAIFGIIKEKGRFLLTAVLAAGCSALSIFNYSTRISDLLVDFVLPIYALAIIAVIYVYRENLQKLLLVATPMAGVLMIVKSTGIVYSGFAILYLAYTAVKYRWKTLCPKTISKDVMCVLISGIPWALWNYRVSTVFSAVDNKFELDVAEMAGIFGDKSSSDVQAIIRLFLETISDINQRATIGIIAFQCVGIIAFIIGKYFLKKKWAIGKVLVALDVIVVLYALSILGMYLFSMPLEEAIYLAGFERYAASIVVFFGGAVTMCLTIDMEASFHYKLGEVHKSRAFKSPESKRRYNNGVVVCIAIALLVLSSEYYGMKYVLTTYEQSTPAQVQEIVGDSWGQVSEEAYLVYGSDAYGEVSNGYLKYVSRYYLWAENVDAICLFYEDNLVNLLSQYDYLVVVDTDESIQELMKQYFDLDIEPGLYEVDSIINGYES